MTMNLNFNNVFIKYIVSKLFLWGVMGTNISDPQKECGKLQKTTKKTGQVRQSKRCSKLYSKLQFKRRVGGCLREKRYLSCIR